MKAIVRKEIHLTIPEVNKLQRLAKKEAVSVKKYMETILSNHANGNPPTIERNQIK